MRKRIATLVVAICCTLAGTAAQAVAAPSARAHTQLPQIGKIVPRVHPLPPGLLANRRTKTTTAGVGVSQNYGGLLLYNGNFSEVGGFFYVPRVNCAGGVTTYASTWDGIGGVLNNGQPGGDINQLGVEEDCINGSPSYYAWYENFPATNVPLATVYPGDLIAVLAESSGGVVTYILIDYNTGFVYEPPASAVGTTPTSAEWIEESPCVGYNGTCSEGALSNFGTVTWGTLSDQYTGANVQLDVLTMNDNGAIATPANWNGDGFQIIYSHQ